MKVALIDTDGMWAFGPRILSGVLKQNGHPAKVIIMQASGRSYTPEQLHALDPLIADCQLIGISCHSIGYDKARQILEHIRPLGKMTVWGGVHATLDPEGCADLADVVCIGEGEGLIVDLVSCLEQGRDWKDLSNAAYREDGRVVRNPLRSLTNIDELPLFDFSCEDEYHLQGQTFARKTRAAEFTQQGIPFTASRGCAFRCTYCCNAKLRQTYAGLGPYVRKHSVYETLARVTALHHCYFPEGKYIFFADDDMLDHTAAELQMLMEAFPTRVNLPFDCQVSPLRVNEQRIDLLAKAGVWRIRMGIESGSDRTKREVYDRPMPNKAVLRAAEVLSRYPAIVKAYYIIYGNPFEEREDLLETIRLILRLPPPFFLLPFNLVFFPGSVLFERAMEAGYITGRGDSGYDSHYRGGLKYEGHAWKRKNLYLNTLVFLMDGKATGTRLGALPRFLVPWLIHPSFVNFNERTAVLARAMIWIHRRGISLRGRIASWVKRIVPDRDALYNPGDFLMSKMRKIPDVAGL